jgi:5-formyltetrahydrofolate cyclo-ligase
VAACEVIIVPVMAVGEDGARLGQGGGSYDRALARLPRAGRVIVALAHDDRVVSAGVLPTERHDVRVDIIVTPHRIIRVPGH